MNSGWSYILAAGVLLLFWHTASILAGQNIISSPLEVIRSLTVEVKDQRFWFHVGASSFRIIAALSISFITAVPLGLIVGSSARADRLARPIIYLTYPVPKIVFLPVIFLVFGLGELGKVVMLSIILFFQLLITTRDAARAVPKSAKYSLYSLGGTRWDLFVHVIWPSTLPSVFTALRIAAGTVVAVLFFVESIGTRYGIGFYILDAWGRADIDRIFGGILVLGVLGVALYESFDLMERFFCRWKLL